MIGCTHAVESNNVGRKTMAAPKKSSIDPCKLFSELPDSDGGNVFDGLKQGRISAEDVKGLKSSEGKPLAFQLRLHLTSYPDLPVHIMDKLDLTAVDKKGNNFLHELSTNISPEAIGMIQYIPSETRTRLLTQPNALGVTPLQFANGFNNAAFLSALNS